MKYAVTILLFAGAFFGCDTSGNMEDPNLNSYARLIGTEGNQTGHDIVVASDGTMILLGNTTSPELNQQLYVVRTTPEGIVLWERSIGDINDDEAKDLELLSGGSSIAILAMREDIVSFNRDYVIRLMTIDGVVTDSVVGGAPGQTEEAFTLTETNDSFIVSGYTTNVSTSLPNPADGFFDRYNKNLTPYSGIWGSKTGFVGDFDVVVRTVESGGLFYVFGYSNQLEPNLSNDGIPDYNNFVWVLGSTGVPRNGFTIGNGFIAGSTLGADETVSSVSVVPVQVGVAPGQAGYVVSGYSRVQGSNEQKLFSIWLRGDVANVPNTKPDGTDNTSAIFAVDPKTDDDAASVISSTSRGSIFPSLFDGFFVLGSKSPNGNEDIYLKRLNSGLNAAWTGTTFFTFGGAGNDIPGAVAETSDGRIIVLGTMLLGDSESTGQRKMILMKLSPNGKLGE